jgi:hypothetical protein
MRARILAGITGYLPTSARTGYSGIMSSGDSMSLLRLSGPGAIALGLLLRRAR